MLTNPVITLTTDFGYQDPFVGIMKGVIMKINPDVNIVDLTHGIRPHDIREAALTLGMSVEFFPKNTIHVVVVDPGVGSNRRPIIVMTDNQYFVGPDNGVFSLIYNMDHTILDVIHITAEHYFFLKSSSTFQGRDIFAPVAAYLSRGINIFKFGEPITDYYTIPMASPSMQNEKTLQGEVILIDRFGNAITNIRASDINKLYRARPDGMLRIFFLGEEIALRNFYSEVDNSSVYALINSSGYLEIFIYKGDAASEKKISVGDVVKINLTDKPA